MSTGPGSEVGAWVLVASVSGNRVELRQLDGALVECPLVIGLPGRLSSFVVRQHDEAILGRSVRLVDGDGVILSDIHWFRLVSSDPGSRSRSRSR